MKKVLYIIFVLALACSFVSCESAITDNSSGISIDMSNYVIDYNNAKSFEDALNDGVKVKGKVVQFKVNEYKPDSALGVNCWSGEHLNFISENELDVEKDDIVIGLITNEPSKILGSWKVPYKVLEISEKEIETESKSEMETNSNTSSKTNTDSSKIIVTMSEEEFKQMSMKDAENKLRDMGFTVFKYDTLDAGDRKELHGKIGAVEIKSWKFGKGDFSVGDTYATDAIVVLWSYEYTKTESDTISNIESSKPITSTTSSEPTSSITSSASEKPSAVMVWIPQSGSRYHSKSSCSGMKGPSQITKDEAIKRGYLPCSKCY